MNIQKTFDALQEDMDNSALGVICSELETQGYSVRIDNVPVKAEDIFEGKHQNIENKIGLLDFTLLKGSVVEQNFSIEFIEFHEIVLKRKPS